MLYRVTDMKSAIYAMKIDSVMDDIDAISDLLEAGDHVLLVNDLQEAADVFQVEVNEIIIVEPGDDE